MNPYAIRKDNLASFAYTNEPLLQQSPQAVALDFHGLNMNQMLQEHSEKARLYAQRGVLLVVPYDNPWSWMNSVAVAETDAIVDAVYAKLSLSDRVPLLSTGGSMGGLSALVFSARSARPVAGCAANCPVCDLPYHYTERPDLPRTILSAFWHEGDIERAILASSPLHLVADLPRIPYYIVHGTADKAVNLQRHSLPLVEAMRGRGLDVRFTAVEGMEHCALPEKEAQCYNGFVFSFAGGSEPRD